jgi:hypothetical protein
MLRRGSTCAIRTCEGLHPLRRRKAGREKFLRCASRILRRFISPRGLDYNKAWEAAAVASDFSKNLKAKVLKPGSPVLLVIISTVAILFWIFWAATSSFWAIWAGAADVGLQSVPHGTASAGAWGDSFGGFNALVGALGFGAVAITLNLQYRSLERQNVDQHVARFEENFFRLIDLMRSLRGSLKYKQTAQFDRDKPEYAYADIRSGHEAIELAYHEVLLRVFQNHAGARIKKSVVAAQYDNYVHNRFEWCFAPYFRIIYTILRNIKQDNILSDDQKAYYGNILRSQLTSFEVGLLAFNATSKYSKDLGDLIVEFRMLKYLPKKRRKVLGSIFPDVAYEARS